MYETGVEGFTPISDALSMRIQQEVPSSKQLLAGSVLEIDGVTIRALWPTPRVLEGQEEKNNTSIVLELIYGETSVLLTGDAEERVELAILSDVQDVDVLKLGHHGSKTSSVYPFLQRTQPEYAIASSGEGNKFGHPHGIVLSRLREIGAEVFVTGRDGDILLTSEGNEPIVAVFPLPF